MAELMLVNPRRRRKASTRKKTRARKAPAKRARRTARRRSNPVTPIRRRSRRVAPRRARRTVARRRNPTGPLQQLTGGDFVNKQLMPAATGAFGAIGLDILWGYVPLPANMKVGPMRHVVKGIGAIGLGMLANMAVRPATARQFTAGALTVVTYEAMRELVSRMMPNVPMGYYSAGMAVDGMGMYTGNGLGAYIGGDTSPYLSPGMLAEPFSGPAPQPACPMPVENGNGNNDGMGYYSDPETSMWY